MAVKLDMSKAYDRVKWSFVKEIMVRMGFPQNWIETLMKCVTTVSYSVFVNGHAGENFRPTRGLRQGDSLLTRVLKAKYYAHLNFLNAQLGNLPSFTWKSVWAAKGLLQSGLC